MMTFRSSFGHHGKALSRASRTTFVERAPRVPSKQAQKAKELFVKKTRIVAAVASAACTAKRSFAFPIYFSQKTNPNDTGLCRVVTRIPWPDEVWADYSMCKSCCQAASVH